MRDMTLAHQKFGLAVYIATSAGLSRYGRDALQLLMQPISDGRIMFAFDEWGEPVAYWLWAEVDEAVSARLLSQAPKSPYISRYEWQCGTDFWILELVAAKERRLEVYRYLAGWLVERTKYAYARVWSERSGEFDLRRLCARPQSRYDRWVSSSAIQHLPPWSFCESYSEWRERIPSGALAF